MGEAMMRRRLRKAVLESISVTQIRSEYIAGDWFSQVDVSVTAYYNDGTQADVTDKVTWEPNLPLSTLDTAITICYEEGGVTVSETIPITVIQRPVSLEVDYNGALDSDHGGANFAWFVQRIVVHYADGTSAELLFDQCTFEPQDIAAHDTTTVMVVSYEENGFTIHQTIGPFLWYP